jgi:prephenate dehydrogenase
MNKLCIVGLGLIGGSVGLAARERRLARKVYGLVRRRESIREAKRLGVVDVATMDAEEAVSNADLVIIATPLSVMERMATVIKPYLSPGCIVTDVGSSKQCVVGAMEKVFHPRVHFIGAHPIAGSERSGMRAARANLFEGAPCILTPTRKTNKKALGKVRRFWQDLGSQVTPMSTGAHDRIVAAISHLPHMLAVALVNCIAGTPGSAKKFLPFAGTGFKDSTRIAASLPDMWVDICLANRDEILRALGSFEKQLRTLKKALRSANPTAVRKLLSRASTTRRKLNAG